MYSEQSQRAIGLTSREIGSCVVEEGTERQEVGEGGHRRGVAHGFPKRQLRPPLGPCRLGVTLHLAHQTDCFERSGIDKIDTMDP